MILSPSAIVKNFGNWKLADINSASDTIRGIRRTYSGQKLDCNAVNAVSKTLCLRARERKKCAFEHGEGVTLQ